MKAFYRFDAVGFFSNILAVILGIIITFSIQGILDRHKQKENISSALRLVRDELAGCRQDLESSADFLKMEKMAAAYLQKNREQLHTCPADSVSQYGLAYISELILTLPDDAMELLKTSSLFPAIDDNALSLAIIRAYDQCDAMRQVFNRHEELKSEVLKEIFLEKGVDKCFKPNGEISISELVNTRHGMYLSTQLMAGLDAVVRNGLNDIDAAIKMIDGYLTK